VEKDTARVRKGRGKRKKGVRMNCRKVGTFNERREEKIMERGRVRG